MGARGIILRTDDGGATWRDQESGIATNLFAISISSRDDLLVKKPGTGLPPDRLDDGTGLGLAICRGIADAHHARLVASNNVGRPGCSFTVEFPIPSGRPTPIAP